VSVLKGEVWKPAWEENTRRKRLAQAADALEMEESIRRLRPAGCGKIESECGSGEKDEDGKPIRWLGPNQKGMAHSGTVSIGSVGHA
jgi:hypothetical protein